MSLVRSCVSALAVVAGLALYSAPVEAVTLPCDGCDAYQMRELAMYSGDGSHTIYNVSAGILRHYQVSGWGESPIEFGEEMNVVEVEASPQERAAMQELQAVAQVYGAPMVMSVEIPIQEIRDMAPWLDPSITAYDIQSNVNIRAAIQTRIESRITVRDGFNTAMERVFHLVNNLFGDQTAFEVKVIIKGDDGSRSTFTKSSVTGDYHYVPGSGRFADGQVLPAANTPEYAGSWTFSGGTSVDDFLGALLDIGARFNGIDGGGGSTVTIVCNWRPNEGILECTQQL
ncbi:hypothetical protein [Stenotrophomonas sp. Ker107b]